MTNEQMLLQIGRMVGDTVRQAVLESEERMKLYVHDVVQASEGRLSQQIGEVDQRLSAAVEQLRESIQHSLEDTERMALQIAATVERM